AGPGVYYLPGGPKWRYAFQMYGWCDLGRSVAAGDYDRAAATLEQTRQRMGRDGEAVQAQRGPFLAHRLIAEVGLATAPSMLPARLLMNSQRDEATAMLVQNEFLVVERADLHVIERMLRLERGQP